MTECTRGPMNDGSCALGARTMQSQRFGTIHKTGTEAKSPPSGGCAQAPEGVLPHGRADGQRAPPCQPCPGTWHLHPPAMQSPPAAICGLDGPHEKQDVCPKSIPLQFAGPDLVSPTGTRVRCRWQHGQVTAVYECCGAKLQLGNAVRVNTDPIDISHAFASWRATSAPQGQRRLWGQPPDVHSQGQTDEWATGLHSAACCYRWPPPAADTCCRPGLCLTPRLLASHAAAYSKDGLAHMQAVAVLTMHSWALHACRR